MRRPSAAPSTISDTSRTASPNQRRARRTAGGRNGSGFATAPAGDALGPRGRSPNMPSESRGGEQDAGARDLDRDDRHVGERDVGAPDRALLEAPEERHPQRTPRCAPESAAN